MEAIGNLVTGILIISFLAMIKPTINFVGSFATPCKQSFYNSSTLFEASKNCILRRVD